VARHHDGKEEGKFLGFVILVFSTITQKKKNMEFVSTSKWLSWSQVLACFLMSMCSL